MNRLRPTPDVTLTQYNAKQPDPIQRIALLLQTCERYERLTEDMRIQNEHLQARIRVLSSDSSNPR